LELLGVLLDFSFIRSNCLRGRLLFVLKLLVLIFELFYHASEEGFLGGLVKRLEIAQFFLQLLPLFSELLLLLGELFQMLMKQCVLFFMIGDVLLLSLDLD